MKRSLVAVFLTVVIAASGRALSADDTDAKAILDTAMNAVGGEARLRKIDAATWKSRGRICRAVDRSPSACPFRAGQARERTLASR